MKNTHNVRGIRFHGIRHRQPGTNPFVGIHAAVDHGYRLVGEAHGWDLHSPNWPVAEHSEPAASNRD